MLLLVGVPWWAAAAFESSCSTQFACYRRAAIRQGLLDRAKRPERQQQQQHAEALAGAVAEGGVVLPAEDLPAAGLGVGNPPGQAAAIEGTVGAQGSSCIGSMEWVACSDRAACQVQEEAEEQLQDDPDMDDSAFMRRGKMRLFSGKVMDVAAASAAEPVCGAAAVTCSVPGVAAVAEGCGEEAHGASGVVDPSSPDTLAAAGGPSEELASMQEEVLSEVERVLGPDMAASLRALGARPGGAVKTYRAVTRVVPVSIKVRGWSR
jgi:hypothetical protein